MKRLAKILALVLLVVTIAAFFRSIVPTFAADAPVCSGPGNNLIANISPEVVKNLRTEATGVLPECYLTATFLFRKWDLEDEAKLKAFFAAAKEYKIMPVIRIASDNTSGGDAWDAIGTDEAELDAVNLSKAIKETGYGQTVYASFGNEVNLGNEWGGVVDEDSYADSLIVFADAAKSNGAGNLKVLIAPMSLSNPDSAKKFYEDLFDALIEKKGVPACSGIPKCDPNKKTLEWINSHIAGYSFNLYIHGNGTDDAKQGISLIEQAGFPLGNKVFVVTEIGVCDASGCGVSTGAAGIQSCQYFSDLQKLDSRFKIATIFARNQSERVSGFYFPFGCPSAVAYNPGKLNLGGSTSHGTSVSVPKAGVPAYPPLGSVQVCPPEIAVDSRFGQETQTGGSCKINRAQIEKLLYLCSHPAEAKKDPNFCSNGLANPISINWCPTKYASDLAKGEACGDGKDETRVKRATGQALDKICNSKFNPEDPGNTIWSFVRCQSPVPPDQVHYVSYCQAYYKNNNLEDTNSQQSASETKNGLPACVPTFNSKARCVSECGQPIKMDENLQIGQITTTLGNCLADSKCRAQIAVKDQQGNNSFAIPFVAKLADYFTGVLDSEHKSKESLDELQKQLRDKTFQQEASEKLLNQAGVAKKLFPEDVQDKLKCDFIQYVKDKKNAKQNTKYIEKINGELTGKEFTVFDKKITEISCPPEKNDIDLYTVWETNFSRYWVAVPLFPNDESQGEIQFISPTVFGTLANESITDQSGNGPFGPVHVSIPEIQRLALATNAIQKALVPDTQIAYRESLVNSTDPLVLQENLPTYGKTIDPKTYTGITNACAPKDWNNFYNNSSQIVYDATKNLRIDGSNHDADHLKVLGQVPGETKSGGALTEYSRAVSCDISNLPGSPDSQICTVGPFGELKCSVQDQPGGKYQAGQKVNQSETVQVRTVFPHLFDIAEQTIGRTTGLLRLYKPMAEQNGQEDEFEKAFDPIPASIDNVYYYLPTSNGLSIDDSQHKESGWELYFYKLGGLWNARKFLLDMLNPPDGGGNKAGIK